MINPFLKETGHQYHATLTLCARADLSPFRFNASLVGNGRGLKSARVMPQTTKEGCRET